MWKWVGALVSSLVEHRRESTVRERVEPDASGLWESQGLALQPGMPGPTPQGGVAEGRKARTAGVGRGFMVLPFERKQVLCDRRVEPGSGVGDWVGQVAQSGAESSEDDGKQVSREIQCAREAAAEQGGDEMVEAQGTCAAQPAEAARDE